MDKEKEEIEELAKKLRDYAYDLKLNNNEDSRRVAEFIVKTLNYRKTEEVTLKLDLSDRTPEEIKRITEQLSEAMSKTPPVVSLTENEIRKETAKEILILVGNMISEDEVCFLKDTRWFSNLCKRYGVEIDG